MIIEFYFLIIISWLLWLNEVIFIFPIPNPILNPNYQISISISINHQLYNSNLLNYNIEEKFQLLSWAKGI